MEERSSERPEAPFSRGRLVLGVAALTIIAALVALALGRIGGSGPGPGVAIYIESGRVYRHELPDGPRKRLAPIPPAPAASLGPRGDRVAYARDQTLRILDLASGRETAASGKREMTPAGWSPDGRPVGQWVRDGARSYVLFTDAREIELLPAGLEEAGPPVWVSSSRYAMHGWFRDVTGLHLISLRRGRPRVVRSVEGVLPLVASADGAELLVQRAEPPRLELLRVRDATATDLGVPGAFTQARSGPTGLVALTGTRAGRTALWILDPVARRIRGVAAAGPDTTFAWLRDGSGLLYASGGSLRMHRRENVPLEGVTPGAYHVVLGVIPR